MSKSILPDPTHLINDAGQSGSGSSGPGFANVSLVSTQPIMRNRSISGRVSTRGIASHRWDISIKYNPLPKSVFNIIYSYLLSKRNGLIPFYVSLPQHASPEDSAMVNNPTTSAIVSAGSMTIPYSVAQGNPSKGDLFTIEDSNDSTHSKAYVVTSISGGVITVNSPVVKQISSGADLIFHDPLIKVLIKMDSVEYTVNTEGLYSLAVSLEEMQV